MPEEEIETKNMRGWYNRSMESEMPAFVARKMEQPGKFERIALKVLGGAAIAAGAVIFKRRLGRSTERPKEVAKLAGRP